MSRWTLLAERENVRRFYTATKLPRSPEEVFYSVRKSREHRKLNRYADVLAYDRTAVSVDGEYLNANVVEDGYGGWWVAAQVCPSVQPLNTSLFTGMLYR
jgi:protein-tyrosine phosphatase